MHFVTGYNRAACYRNNNRVLSQSPVGTTIKVHFVTGYNRAARYRNNNRVLSQSPVGTTIKVRFVDIFSMRCSLGCDDDWVEVRLKSIDRPGPRYRVYV